MGGARSKPGLSYSHGTGGPALWGCTIGEALDRAALLHPDLPALISCHQHLRYSYREFLAEVNRAARGFLHLGIEKGDRVGVWTTNYAEWVIAQFATAKIGAILVTINPAYRASELDYALRQSECSTLLLMRGFRDCDYVETLASICPEFAASRPGDLRSSRQPFLKNVIFVGGNLPADGPPMFTWEDLAEMGRRESPEEFP